MLGSWIRRRVFWVFDFLKGRPIRKQYLDIKRMLSLSDRDLLEEQNRLLKKVIEHAKRTVPFYSHENGSNIDQMPIVSKAIIKDNYEQFKSGAFLNAKKIHTMSTSGSTGTPFTVIQDKNKRNRVLAELIYYNEIAGQRIGDRFVFTRVWTDEDLHVARNSKLSMFAKNEIPVDISVLNDSNLESLRFLLKKDKSINEMMGYASTHKKLVQYLEKCGDSSDDFHLRVIISGSEMLEASVKSSLQKMFGCSVISRYSNQENGVLAQQRKDSDDYDVNVGSYYIELLKLDSDAPVVPGEVGRIVITDLFNYAMPMIRYDTGDLGVIEVSDSCQLRVFKSIEGRRVDVCVSPDGRMLSPFLLDKHMERFDSLAQFQFIQKGKNNYVFKINDPQNVYTDEQFSLMLKELLGEHAVFTIERVSGIPCTSSGKFKQMICESTE